MKAKYLLKLGWKPVPGENGGTAWQAPVTLTGKPHFFDLDAAYELETIGVGCWAYSGQEALIEALMAQDEAFMEASEAARFSETGIRLGIFPNY